MFNKDFHRIILRKFFYREASCSMPTDKEAQRVNSRSCYSHFHFERAWKSTRKL